MILQTPTAMTKQRPIVYMCVCTYACIHLFAIDHKNVIICIQDC